MSNFVRVCNWSFQAIKSLIDNKAISLGSHKGGEQAYIDKVDLAIRVQLNMVRQLKQKVILRNRILRSLGLKERARVNLVLERIQLPPELLEGDMEELNDEALVEISHVPALPPPLAIQDAPPCNPAPAPPKKLKSESFDKMMQAPSIFQKILNRSASADHVPKTTPSQDLSEGSVIAKAMAYQPKQCLVVAKEKKVSKPKALVEKKTKKKTSQGKKTGSKNTSKKASQTKDPPAKQTSKAKAKARARPSLEATGSMPDFDMELQPRETDTYKNQYASRQHHKAFDHAMRWGKSKEDASMYARSIAAKAREIWDNLNPS